MSFKSGVKGRRSDRWWGRMCMRWYAHDEVNREQSEQNEIVGMKKEADSTGKVR